MIKGEMSAKTTYQRSAKGPVSISECSADGKYVSLENTGRKVLAETEHFTAHLIAGYLFQLHNVSSSSHSELSNRLCLKVH